MSLFTGAGGLDIGLERAGLKAISLSEVEEVFCGTLKANQKKKHSDGVNYFRDARILNADIREVSGTDLADTGVDLVVGGPPCQAFSSAGKQLSVLDPRGLLSDEFIRIVGELQPKMFLLENVRGLVTARDGKGEPGGVISTLHRKLQHLGYSCRATLLNAADFGAYQRRVRCFIVGTQKGTAPLFPDPSHQKTPDMFHERWKSLRMFLREHCDAAETNFVFPTENLRAQLEALPDGTGIKSAGRVEKTRPGGHWGYRQGTFIANLDLPARTVTGSASQDWIRWNGLLRRLTLNEVSLLQGFPSDWEFLGTNAQKFKQVGNAVPSTFGEILGTMIKQFLKNFPDCPSQSLELPKSFNGYIDYTKKDQARNGDSRVVHRNFQEN